MTHKFDPELEPLIELLPKLDISDVTAARALMAAMREQLPPFVAPESISVDKRIVPGPGDNPDVEVWIFSPRQRTVSGPGLLYIHGGGFVLGDVAGDADSPARVAAEVGAVVVSVEYRLAPEHPFPAPAEDCYAALRWTAEHAEELGIDPARLAIGGQSAGAGLAAGVALMARDRGGPQLCFQVLDIPELDDRLGTASMKEFIDTPLWNLPNAIKSWEYYLGARAEGEPVSEYAAPARAVNLAGLPPTYVAVCEFDPLRDEGIEYAQRLIQAGVATELHLYPGTFHGSSGAGADAAISIRMNEDRVAALCRGVSVGAS